MKKRSKRLISMLLAGIMIFSLAGCGGDSSEDAAAKAEAKKYVYDMQNIDADIFSENENVYDVACMNDRIYAITREYRWDEMTGMVIRLVSVKEDGSDRQETELVNTLQENPDYYVEPDEGTDDGTVDGDYDVMPLDVEIAITEEITTEETTEATTQEAVDGAQEMHTDSYMSQAKITSNGVCLIMENNSYYYDEMGNYMSGGYALNLCVYELTGEERFETTLNESADEYLYINAMAADAEGNLALTADDRILVYDNTGNKTGEIDTSNMGYVQNSFMDGEGKLNLVAYNDDWTKLYIKVFNIRTKDMEQEVELPGSLNNYGINPGVSYDLLLTSSMGVFGYNIGDEDVTQIMSYINSDIDSTSINNIYEMDENRLLCTYYDEETYAVKLAVMSYVDPATIPDKEVVTIACYYLDYNMRKRVVAFNKENELYRITVKDYSTYSTMDDYSAGYTQLNNDILAGQVPDIMILDSANMPIESYIAKGVLADIGKMIEEDEELSQVEYMTNVFDAYSVDGKLYSVIPSFYVSTVLGKTADVGETPGWTMDDLKALMAEHPDASVFGDSTTRSEILWEIMTYSGSRFVNRSTGECHFNSEEFISVLEFVAQFPEEFDWGSVEDDYWMTYETQYRSGKTLLMQTSITDFENYCYYAQGYFGEPVTMIGFPSEEGIGAVVRAYDQYAIAAKSSNKEGAWEFLRYYLTEEYQMDNNRSYGLPTIKSALLAKLEEAKERPYWEDEEGNKEYYDNTYWIGEEEIIIQPLTDEEADELFNYISSVNQAYYYDESLNNIITEEAAAFFEGQKTAAEVAEIIQSRAQIYINESR